MAAPGDTQDLLRTAFATANERWPGLGIELPAFVDAAEAHARSRLEKLGLEATAERLAQALGRMCLEDLCLACACDAGSEEAWSAFHAGYRLRLLGLAVKQGLDRERADAQVGALLSDLALPPARVAAATLLGTYRGTGSLFGWLAVILVRRIARDARRARPVSLEAVSPESPDPALARTEDPGAPLADAEAAGKLSAALRAGWAACTPREQLALALKHRDGLPHREIARVLDVGVPRISQLLQQGLARLAAEARRRLPDGLEARAYEAALAATEKTLATIAPSVPPSGTGRPSGDRT